MAELKDPHKEGLTPELFAKQPEWSKMAFAYRLFCTLCPPGVSRRLQKYLLKAMFAPGVSFPPGVIFPPGTTFPPGYTIPPGWSPGDPLPGGFVFPPGFPFPAGWNPGDPLSWEMIMQLLGLDDFPNGYPLSPMYLGAWEPGPINAGGSGLVEAEPVEVLLVGSDSDGKFWSKDANWNTARIHGFTFQLKDDETSSSDGLGCYLLAGSYNIFRVFLFFDLSTIPAGKTVTAAEVRVAGGYFANSTITLQKGTQEDPLVATDFLAFAGTPFASAVWQISTDPENDANVFTLNAAGLAYLSSILGGTAKFCLRDYEYDYLNTPPDGFDNYNGLYFAEDPRPAYRPSIKVAYL